MSLKSRIEHLIKFSSVANRFFTVVASLGVTCLGMGTKVQDDLILFVSDIGKSYTGSPRALYEYMCVEGLLDGMRVVWAFERPEEHSDMGCHLVKLDSAEYFRMAQQARYWVSDVNVERGLSFKRPRTTYLNTWHGTSFKTLGWDIHGRIYYDCSSVDFMCASSEYDVDTFSRAFRMSKERFLRCGLPRNDQLFAHRGDDPAEWKRHVGLPEDKRVVLYAPTWRDTTDGGATYSIEPPVDIHKWHARLGGEWVLVFRMHPLTREALGLEPDAFLLDYSRYQPLNELLLAADLLVTDYSSIAFDYAILNRPALCFGYDAECYQRVRGIYLDVADTFPHGNCRTEDELLDEIESVDSWGAEEFSAPLYKDFNVYGGNACRQCCKALFGEVAATGKG